ncbi:MAG: tetratricopeptide repeat protein [Gammaproteobacteria bacterium]|nr:tetratricopeptide repeat protein [Gammaproteobacteria bacterium]
MLNLTYSRKDNKPTDPTIIIHEQPVVIEIENELDEKSLTNLLRLVGEYSTKMLSQQEAQTITDLLIQHQLVERLKYKKTGIRIIFRIPKNTFEPLYHLPPVFTQFTGREQELSQLKTCRSKVQNITAIQISGSGGIGKSQLANYFARWQFREKYYSWVVWFTGGVDENSTRERLQSQLAELGLGLGLDVKRLKERELYRLIYKRLAEKGHGLVVFDGVPNGAVFIPFSPASAEQPQLDVLITTINNLTLGPDITKITLDVFLLDDAIRYIKSVLRSNVSDNHAELLAVTLGRYPLALSQALAYIVNADSSIQIFCKNYITVREAMASYLRAPVFDTDPYKATISAVITLSLECLKSLLLSGESYQETLEILMSTIYLAAEVAIPKALLRGWITNDQGEIKLNDSLKSLRTFCLLEQGDQRESFRIHQVIQDVLKIDDTPELTVKRLLKWRGVLKEFNSSSSYLSEIVQKRCVAVKSHALCLANQFNLVAKTDETLIAQGYMYHIGGLASQILGEDSLSKLHYMNELRCYEVMRSEDKFLIGMSKIHLGGALLVSGDLQNAKNLLLEAYEILRKILREDHPEVGGCMMTLGNVCLENGDIEEAIFWLNNATRITKIVKQNDPILYAKSLLSLGNAHLECGNPMLASTKSIEAFEILESEFEEPNSDMGRCLIDLGNSKLDCGEALSAQSLFEKALPIIKNCVGENHLDFGKCLLGLASTYIESGNLSLAYEYLERVEKIFLTTLSSNHVLYGACIMNMGTIALQNCQFSEAIRLFERALPLFQRLVPRHPRMGFCLMGYGWILAEMGAPDEGVRCLNEALDILTAKLGPENIKVALCKANLGWAMFQTRNLKIANEIFEEVIPVIKARLNEHTHLGNVLMNCGLTKLASNQRPMAEKMISDALKIFEKNLGPKSLKYAICSMNLSSTLLQTDPGRARTILVDALPIIQIHQDAAPTLLGKCLTLMVMVNLRCNDIPTARSLLAQAEPVVREVMRSKYSTAGGMCLNLGVATYNCGDVIKAKRLFEEASAVLASEGNTQGVDQGKCLTFLGITFLKSGSKPAAVKILKDAFDILDAAPEASYEEKGLCMVYLGWGLLGCEKITEAKKWFTNAVSILKGSQVIVNESLFLGLIGLTNAKLYLRETQNIRSLLLETVNAIEKSKNQNNPIIGKILFNFGGLLMECGEFSLAETVSRNAYARLKMYESLDPDIGRCLVNLGNAIQAGGNIQGAIVEYQNALTFFRNSKMKLHSDIATCLMNLATVNLLSDPLSEVKENLEEARREFEACPILQGAEVLNYCKCLLKLGNVYARSDDITLALELFEKTILIIKGCPGENNRLKIECLMCLGQAKLQCDDPLGAKADTMEALRLCKITSNVKPEIIKLCQTTLDDANTLLTDNDFIQNQALLNLPNSDAELDEIADEVLANLSDDDPGSAPSFR